MADAHNRIYAFREAVLAHKSCNMHLLHAHSANALSTVITATSGRSGTFTAPANPPGSFHAKLKKGTFRPPLSRPSVTCTFAPGMLRAMVPPKEAGGAGIPFLDADLTPRIAARAASSAIGAAAARVSIDGALGLVVTSCFARAFLRAVVVTEIPIARHGAGAPLPTAMTHVAAINMGFRCCLILSPVLCTASFAQALLLHYEPPLQLRRPHLEPLRMRLLLHCSFYRWLRWRCVGEQRDEGRARHHGN